MSLYRTISMTLSPIVTSIFRLISPIYLTPFLEKLMRQAWQRYLCVGMIVVSKSISNVFSVFSECNMNMCSVLVEKWTLTDVVPFQMPVPITFEFCLAPLRAFVQSKLPLSEDVHANAIVSNQIIGNRANKLYMYWLARRVTGCLILRIL